MVIEEKVIDLEEIVMHESRAELIIPVARPRDLVVELASEGPAGSALAVTVNGRPVGTAGPGTSVLDVPEAILFRGDNSLALIAPDGVTGMRLRRFGLRPRP